MKRDNPIPEGLKVPSPLSCLECLENEKRVIHFAFEYSFGQDDVPHREWSWNIMDHDKTSRFRWPASFDSRDEARDHINSIIEDATGEIDFVV